MTSGAADPICVRSDCPGQGTGKIVDGFCDECGFAPAKEPDHRSASHSALPTPTSSTVASPCAGCGGEIVDGYCNRCGLRVSEVASPTLQTHIPPAAATPAASGPAPAASSSAVSQPTFTIRHNVAAQRSAVSAGATGATAGTRGNLGAGLVEIPSVPKRDPRTVVLVHPEVPERRRFCASCDFEVGRSHPGRPARTEGFCPRCGKPYSFTPKLSQGDLVGGQYEVAGCIAHGGLGWVYLAQDRNVEDRWVVLKGLLDSNDESAMTAAVTERRFLAEVEHPNIVKIHNFVDHDGAGYIVMEYVGGESLRELRNRHREEEGAPLPVAWSIAYVLEILPAFGYLHRRGFLYCDFKPDNVIQTEEQLTLIDLGAVRHIDDPDSALYGTDGYQAPEVNAHGASTSSDLYTVARTLAVLSIDIPGYQDEKRYATRLPPLEEVPAFRRYESFYHFMVKATAADPGQRFQSAGEMAAQLVGVLRQVCAVDGGSPKPAPSVEFSTELGADTTDCLWQFLPVPTVDHSDPNAGILATLALLAPDQRRGLLQTSARSPELALNLAGTAIDEGAFDVAARELDSTEARSAGWRAAWWRGVLHLAEGRPDDGLNFFSAVAGQLPGELAPRLAIGLCHEQLAIVDTGPAAEKEDADARRRHLDQAAEYYTLVSATDPGYASASFGLARIRTAMGDRDGAVAALQAVPRASSSYVAAQVALCRAQCGGDEVSPPTLIDLTSTARTLGDLTLDSSVRLPLLLELHGQALAMLLDGRVTPNDEVKLAGAALDEAGQRTALERTYRLLAKLADTDAGRWNLIDLANQSRPRTMT